MPFYSSYPAQGKLFNNLKSLLEEKGLCRKSSGLKTMGSVAQGQFEAMLGPYALNLHAAWESVHEAERLSKSLIQYLRESMDEVRVQYTRLG